MRRLSGLWRLAAASFVLVTFGLLASGVASAQAEPEVYIRVENTATDDPDDLVEVRLDPDAPTATEPRGKLPVLFVHGHNADSSDNPPNYRNNWQTSLNGLPSFMATLDLNENARLGIEDYYIRFSDQNHSIADDAADIAAAVELILTRHDPEYRTRGTTNVRVVIIAYSKGTLSARLYLKNLEAERRSFRPVSEFIAIAPPNHGINVAGLSIFTSTAVQEMVNGHGLTNCSPRLFPTPTRGFIANLNGHPITDTLYRPTSATDPSPLPPAADEREAPDSRSPTERPTEGILYVTLFASENRDFVGGDTIMAPPDDDCQGRRLAKNLSPDAVNIPVAGITENGWENVSDFFGVVSEAQKKAIAVHQNTVHTPEVICLALYAAVHQRSPEGQSCTPGASGSPIIPPPARAAAVLALDFSGSMSLPACPGCANTRADALKESVVLFIELWRVVNVPSDRLGVAYFSTNVTGGEALLPLDGSLDDIIADLRGQTPDGMTAMGGGLYRAIDTLRREPDLQTRRVILFTDGMQNVNPMVQTAGGDLVIDNQPGRQNSNVSPASPTTLDASLGVAVDTIGVGAGQAFVGLLNDIAARTGGRASITTEPDELRRFFVEELINALRGFSPQLVAYRRGAVAAGGGAEAFDIEDGARKLVFKVSWKRGDSLDFRVARDGVDVTSAGRFVAGDFYKIFVIDLPSKGATHARGNWQLRIDGKAATPYEAAAIVDGGQVEYDATFDAARPRAGDPLDLIVRLTAGGRPIGAKVTVTWTSPAAAAGDIIVNTRLKELRTPEPAMTLAERQLLAPAYDGGRRAALKPRHERLILHPTDKGEFRARLSPQAPGIHTALVTIEGDDARLGRFSRTMTATTVVRFAAAPLKAGDVFTSECNVGGRRYVRLIMSPRDARGRRMGPGLASEISVRLAAGRAVGGPQDLGDGSYMIVLQVTPGDDPPIELEAGGGALFSGRLSQLSARLIR